MKKMLSTIRSLAMLCLLATGYGQVRASHAAGADLTWTCDPANPCLITFTMSFYLDCSGTPNYGPPFFYFDTPAGCTATPVISTNWAGGIVGEITPLCATAQSNCNGGTVMSFRQYRHTVTYDFCANGTPCSTYGVRYNINARNESTSLFNPPTVDLSTTSLVSINPNRCNSSPTFNTVPIVYICDGQVSNFTQGATDPDGNTLQYSLTNCMQNATQSTPYRPGFSGTTPLGPTWTTTINSSNGDITFAPNPGGPLTAVLCVRVEELDAMGNVIGHVIRDIQVKVVDCDNNLPTLSGPYTYDLCVGPQFCFNLTSADLDPNDVLSVTVISNPSNIPVTISGTPYPTVTGCWTPTTMGLYTLSLQVRDDACPINGIQQYTYTFRVKNCDPCDQIQINPSFTHTENGLTTTVTNTTTVTPSNLGPIFTHFRWGDGSSTSYPGVYTTPLSHTYTAPGTYTICVVTEAFIGNVCCHDSVCTTITIDPCDLITINPSFTHVENVLQTVVTNTSTVTPANLGPIFTHFLWGDGSTTVYGGNYTSPVSHTYAAPGTYNVCVVIEAFVGNTCCHDTICELITITDDPCDFYDAHFVAAGNISPPCTYTFWDNSTPASSVSYWDFGDGSPLGVGSPVTHTFTASGTYTVTLFGQHHPPGHPELCCYDTYSETYRVDCGRDPKGGGDGRRISSSVTWNNQQDQLQVRPGHDLLGDKPVQAGVFDMSGKQLLSFDITGTESEPIDFSAFASGVYFVRITGNGMMQTTKFIKQ